MPDPAPRRPGATALRPAVVAVATFAVDAAGSGRHGGWPELAPGAAEVVAARVPESP